MKSQAGSTFIQHVSAEQAELWRQKAAELIGQARYKQAVQVLNQALASGISLAEQIQFLGYRAYAHTLWRKPEAAIEDATRLLTLIQAEVSDLCFEDIDWAYEREQDTGYLSFLAAIYNLRGTLRRVQKDLPAAIEDLTLALFMSEDPYLQGLSLFQRGFCLLQLGECQERALSDLSEAWQFCPAPLAELLGVPSPDVAELRFDLHDKGLQIYWEESASRALSGTQFELRLKDLQAEFLAFSRIFSA